MSTLILSAGPMSLTSCENDGPADAGDSPLVIEGWIEDGAAPVVMVTHAVDLLAGVDDFDGCVEKWARVSVDDGDGPVLLNAKIDHNYFPPLIYTSSRIKGVAGKTYVLKVETEDKTVTAVTEIPKATRLKKFITTRCEGTDSLYSLSALVNVDPEQEGYYKFLVKVNSGETRYYSSFLGTFMASDYDPEEGWQVQRGIHDTAAGNTFTPHYHVGDTVAVKFCTMERQGYDYWTAYENVVSFGNNLLFPAHKECRGNISEGGRGYWLGYGVSYGRIVIKPQD